MTDNVARREIQRRDDPFGIPACFYWTIDEVADWVESIGYAKYKENFRSHFINGRKLLTVDACVLPKMGITHFGDILNIQKALECLFTNRQPNWYPLPYSHLPRMYKFCLNDQPPGNTESHLYASNIPPRTDRLLQASVSYPWEYLTWKYY